MVDGDFSGELPHWCAGFDCKELLQSPVESSNQNFVEDRHRSLSVRTHKGLRITTPSTVGVRPPVSSITSLSRSPPGAMNEIAGVLSSDGVTPAVPPPWIGVLSWIVSEPLQRVSLEVFR